MSKACRDIFCFDAYVKRGGAWVGWWDEGKGQNLRSGYIFIYVKWAEFISKSICIHILCQIICVTLTRIEVVKENRIFCKTLAGKSR